MAARRLSTDEQALWARVTATVRALGVKPPVVAERPARIAMPSVGIRAAAAAPARPAAAPGDALDGGWERRLRRGMTTIDRTIDLHGHTVASAHAALDFALEQAILADARLLLVITGRPPRGDDLGDGIAPRRGRIRAAIGDWLGSSRHAGRIAAVRNAHPRHGGAGALYVILRRRR